MKKFMMMFFAIVMLVSLAACTGGQQEPDASVSSQGQASSKSDVPVDETTPSTADDSKVLVAYFSATGTTKRVAEITADYMQADLYEIVPQDPYTTEDLDYHRDDSRSTKEMNDVSARPVIAGTVGNMEQYDVVLLGYPIWWGDAPRIMSTFVESYSLGGKTVIPFCTSASSGIGSSGKNLERLTAGANWLDGRRFSNTASEEEIHAWVDGLTLD